MGRWFRFYDDALNDPKVLRLPDGAYRGWVNLMCIASKNDGFIEADISNIAISMRKSEQKVRGLIQTLQSAGLLDIVETGWKPHNWEARQYKSDVSTDRVKRFRKRSETVSETAPDTEQIQSRTDKKEVVPAIAVTSKPGRKVTSSLPENFPTADDMRRACAFWAGRKRQDLVDLVQDEALAFRAHHAAHGKRMADWGQAWVTWYSNAIKFNRKQDHGKREKPLSAHDNFNAGTVLYLNQLAREAGGQGEDSGPPDETRKLLLAP